MYEYMRGLQRQFFKEPDFLELRQELNELHQELAEDSPKDERRKLLKLVDLEAELRDEISLASFAAGFRLAWGIIGELNIEPPYSFAEEEERRMGQLADLRRDDEWQSAGRPVTAWCANATMVAGRAASWWDTRKTATLSFITTMPTPRKS